MVERHPDHSDGFINLGVLAGRRGNTESALEYFDRAIAIDANDFDAYSKKGQLLVVEKRYEESLAAFNKAVEINPNYTPAKQAAAYVQDIINKKNEGYIRVRQILVTDGEMAQRLKAEIDKGTDFAALASRYSADASSKFGGDLGFVKRGDLMQAIEDVIFALDVGELSEIVETRFGYHIITLTDRVAAGVVPYEEAKDNIGAMLERNRKQNKMDEYLEGLRSRAVIEYADTTWAP